MEFVMKYSAQDSYRKYAALYKRAMTETCDQITKSYHKGPVTYLQILVDGQPMRRIKVLDFPEVRQVYEFDCGAAAMCTIINYYGMNVSESKIIEIAHTNNHDGTNPSGMIKAGEAYGLKWKHGRASVEDLKNLVDRGIPTLILLQAWSERDNPDYSGYRDDHWVVVIGYDHQDRIYFEDPRSPTRTWLTKDELDARWHSLGDGNNKIDHYALYFYGKVPAYRSTTFVHMR